MFGGKIKRGIFQAKVMQVASAGAVKALNVLILYFLDFLSKEFWNT